MSRSRPRAKPSMHLTCANCGALVDVIQHGLYPETSARPDHVHHVDRLDQPRTAVLCTCGHFTVNRATNDPA